MLKAEVREDFQRSKRAAEFGALGIVMLTVGFLALVGALFAGVGIACAVTAYLLLERFNPLPDKTFNALQENLTWKTT